jgi:hypothetical protein
VHCYLLLASDPPPVIWTGGRCEETIVGDIRTIDTFRNGAAENGHTKAPMCFPEINDRQVPAPGIKSLNTALAAFIYRPQVDT